MAGGRGAAWAPDSFEGRLERVLRREIEGCERLAAVERLSGRRQSGDLPAPDRDRSGQPSARTPTIPGRHGGRSPGGRAQRARTADRSEADASRTPERDSRTGGLPRAGTRRRLGRRLRHGVARRRRPGRADRPLAGTCRSPSQAGAAVRRDPGPPAHDRPCRARPRPAPRALECGRLHRPDQRPLRGPRHAAADDRFHGTLAHREPARVERTDPRSQRLPQRQPDDRQDGRRRGARLGDRAHRRPDARPGLDLHELLALRRRARAAGRRLRHLRGPLRRLRGDERKAGRPEPGSSTGRCSAPTGGRSRPWA